MEILLLCYIISIIFFWPIFSKAQRPAWLSIIPVYNWIILLNIVGRSGWWVIPLNVPIVQLFVFDSICDEIAIRFGKSKRFFHGRSGRLFLLQDCKYPVKLKGC